MTLALATSDAAVSRGQAGAWLLSAFAQRRWTWWLLALCVIVVKLSAKAGGDLGLSLGDTDDATRLVQVRELIATGNWFEPWTAKLGGADGMLTHWSRLVDAPLVLLLSLFGLVLPQASAELALRAMWPVVVMAPMLWVLYRGIAHMAGETAGRFGLLLAVACPAGFYQFIAGRIDHHNVMISATICACVLLIAYPNQTRAWTVAGAAAALAMAVGYEALPQVLALAAMATLWGLFDRNAALPSRAFMSTLALGVAAAFVITVPPQRYLDIRCDALSLNMVLLLGAGAFGVALAARALSSPIITRLLYLAVPAAAGLAAFGALEPACLAGPTGQVPAALKPIWLDTIEENRSIARDLLLGDIGNALGLIVFFAFAIAAQVARVVRTRAAADAALLALLAAFTALACFQFKFVPYASVLALLPLAALIGNLQGFGTYPASTVRLVATLVLGQGLLMTASNALAGFISPKPPQMSAMAAAAPAGARATPQSCFANSALQPLNQLTAGLMAADMDAGAFIAAVTHHRALAAPYHRIPDAIIANEALFGLHEAHDIAAALARAGIDYVAFCAGLDAKRAARKPGSLLAQLAADAPPAFLEPVSLTGAATPYRVWRVNRDKFNLPPSAAAASTP